ncbi:MAG: hypothetical protein KKG10_00855, partial [Proteobacteria bacterium]|nr:hypothetical protein [Pseudomonadota bacterium]
MSPEILQRMSSHYIIAFNLRQSVSPTCFSSNSVRPLKNAQFWSRSRKANILTTSQGMAPRVSSEGCFEGITKAGG